MLYLSGRFQKNQSGRTNSRQPGASAHWMISESMSVR